MEKKFYSNNFTLFIEYIVSLADKANPVNVRFNFFKM